MSAETETQVDEDIATVLSSLLHARRTLGTLDPQSFQDLLGAVMVEVRIGIEIAEEMALEARHRPRHPGTVIPFPAPQGVRNGAP